MQIKKTVMTMILLFLAVSLYCLPLYAQNQVKNYRFSDDVKIEGVWGGYTMPFYVDEQWKVQDGSFWQINFSQSQIKEYPHSTMTFYLNDLPIKSILLADWKPSGNQLKVDLPKDKLQPGFNQLSVKTYHRITDEKCFTDQVNQAAWLLLAKSSYLHLEYIPQVDPVSLKDYPYPYLQKALDQPVQAKLILPVNPSDQEMTAAIMLAADLGKREVLKNLFVPIIRYDQLKKEDQKSNLIFLGSVDSLPSSYRKFFNQEELAQLDQQGLIKEIASPYSAQKKMLFIISRDQKKLLAAVRTLGTDSLVRQMRSNVQLLGEFPQQKFPDLSQNRVSFADLGYADLLMKGLFNQQISYGIKVPKDKKLTGSPIINLNFRYSKAINFAKSSVTVYLNNLPLTSQRLTKEKADNDFLTVEIPEEYRSNNYYEVKLVFYLEPAKLDCQIRGDGNIWAFVSNQSYFHLPYQLKEGRNLEDYPSPLVQNKAFNNLTLVVPDNPDSQELTMAANLAAFLGHHVQSLDNLAVVQSRNLRDKNRNLIVIGTPARNKTIQELNKHLHLKFAKDYSRFLSNEKIALLDDFSRQSSAIQIIKSPWSEERSILVFTSPSKESLYLSQIFLTNSDYVRQLKGDAGIVDELGYLQTAYFLADGEEASQKSLWDIILVKNSSKDTLLSLAVMVGATMLIIGLLFIFRKK